MGPNAGRGGERPRGGRWAGGRGERWGRSVAVVSCWDRPWKRWQGAGRGRCQWLPWPDGGRVGGGHRAVPGASGDCGRAAGHTLALPGHRRRGGWQCRQSCRHANSAAASSPCAGECVPDSRPRGSAAPVAAGAAARVGRASRRRRRRAPDGGAHGTPKGTRPARIPEEDRARVAGGCLVLEDLSLVQFKLYQGGVQILHCVFSPGRLRRCRFLRSDRMFDA